MDCAFGAMENPKETAHHLDHVVGSVEHGMFLKFAQRGFRWESRRSENSAEDDGLKFRD